MVVQPCFLPLHAPWPMKTKCRSGKFSNHITKELRHKNLSFWTVEIWFCYILPQICLEITKTVLEKTSKDQFPATRGLFMCPLLPQPHQTESRDVLFGSLSSSFLPVVAGLSTPLPYDLILQLQHLFFQWRWLDFDLKLLFVTPDVNLLHPFTDLTPRELSVITALL